MTDAVPSPGQVLAGKFRVERVLGKGGMGMVVAARHIHLDDRVAIKVLLPEMINAEIVARFIREAQAAVRIRSEHVARVSDVGALDDGAPYMVMEYLDGQDLSQVLADRGALSVDEVVEYVLQACAALAEAHALGIAHRDLKPANLFLTRRVDGSPCVKVLDFGISKLISQDQAALTKTGGMLGSPLYMSPEQLTNSKQVDARTDLWSLGVIMYELLSGSPPFLGAELPLVIVNVLQGEVRPLYDCHLPDGFEAIVMRCLARDRERRFQSVLELSEALAPFASPRALRPLDAIRAISGAAPSVATSQRFTSDRQPTPAQRTTSPQVSNATTVPSRRDGASPGVPLWIAPVLIGLLVAVGLGVTFLVRSFTVHAPVTAASTTTTEPPATPTTAPSKAAPVEAAPSQSVEAPPPSASASASSKPKPTTKPKRPPKAGPGVIDDPL